MQQEGGNIRNIDEHPKGPFQGFANKLAALLLSKKAHVNNGLADVLRDTIYTNILKKYSKADEQTQDAFLKSIENKSFEELNDIHFNPEESSIESESMAS